MERDCSEEEVGQTHSRHHTRLHKRQTPEEPRRAVVEWPCASRDRLCLVLQKRKSNISGRGKIALAKRFVKCLRNDCQSSLEMSPFSISLRSLLLVDRCLCPQRSPAKRLFNDHRAPFRGHSERGWTADPANQGRKSYAAVTRKMRSRQLIGDRKEKMVPGVGVEPT